MEAGRGRVSDGRGNGKSEGWQREGQGCGRTFASHSFTLSETFKNFSLASRGTEWSPSQRYWRLKRNLTSPEKYFRPRKIISIESTGTSQTTLFCSIKNNMGFIPNKKHLQIQHHWWLQKVQVMWSQAANTARFPHRANRQGKNVTSVGTNIEPVALLKSGASTLGEKSTVEPHTLGPC